MLSIRLLRIGKKHQPSYKIVVVDKKRSPKSGKFTEQLGFYNPITKEKKINKERVEYWLSQGAQPSDTVHNFLIREGAIKGKKISVHSTKKRKKEEAKEAPVADAPKEGAEKGTETLDSVKEETPIESVKEKKKEEESKENSKKESEDSKEKPIEDKKPDQE